ncbi:Mor transcription activator family protein [Candidatus Williamhamiltonella defendens]|uniref:Uncharacterized protein n=1 Tax=Candidatus Hamiltonella defensa (Bemisia tabaci) TaxID=672795 RepID=A0A0E4G398_9ENTR|nr:Mor transcription activator family protein [Candidatus Hamiltonella defensa]ASX25912.1 hypothetical protein BA171_01860 [Candidatus Hamiltonella defensa (Bemisia tabaci)]CED78818.1 Protein of unknown function (Mor transcription activator) [Candidatus Hamiltonella defensa (Bemisia tabaci)]CED79505.1 Conserved hypothetical protein (Mor transcription activator domain) [Candidatus Hamiltonella defensa (Bemisia tabaci)]
MMATVINDLAFLDSLESSFTQNLIKPLSSVDGKETFNGPKKIQADDPLALLLGGQDAERLCAHYAGTVLDLLSKYFFRAVRNHHLRQDYHSGNVTGSRADHLALKYGLSRRQVLNVVREQN